jgi:hypothetical protein
MMKSTMIALGAVLVSAAPTPMVDSTTSTLAITFSDCGSNAHAVVKSVTPNVMQLGGTTAFTGAGTNTGDITSASWTMRMTGVGGVTLLDCSGDDASVAAECNIGLGPVHVGKATYVPPFPFHSGDISLDDIVSIELPAGLPSFALRTTTTLTATAQDGQQAFCVQITSEPTMASPPAPPLHHVWPPRV